MRIVRTVSARELALQALYHHGFHHIPPPNKSGNVSANDLTFHGIFPTSEHWSALVCTGLHWSALVYTGLHWSAFFAFRTTNLLTSASSPPTYPRPFSSRTDQRLSLMDELPRCELPSTDRIFDDDVDPVRVFEEHVGADCWAVRTKYKSIVEPRIEYNSYSSRDSPDAGKTDPEGESGRRFRTRILEQPGLFLEQIDWVDVFMFGWDAWRLHIKRIGVPPYFLCVVYE